MLLKSPLFIVILTYILCTQNISSTCTRLVFQWLLLRTCSKLLNHTNFGTLIGVKPSLVTTAARDRIPVSQGSNTGVGMWQDSGRPKSVVFSGYSGFLHHVRPQNTNILAFKNVFISSTTFLCNRSSCEINSFLNSKLSIKFKRFVMKFVSFSRLVDIDIFPGNQRTLISPGNQCYITGLGLTLS